MLTGFSNETISEQQQYDLVEYGKLSDASEPSENGFQ